MKRKKNIESAPQPEPGDNGLAGTLRSALVDCPLRRKYLIGVSGGRDSMALLHLLHSLGYRRLVVCHLNHGLRGRAAARDAARVRAAARRLGYPSETGRADTAAAARRDGKSIELAARDLRRTFFADCAKRHRCRRLFLAHHADDQVETILFNFLRGTGASGLGGMSFSAPRDGLEIFRPLLGVPGRTIAEYVRARDVPFGEDASNADPSHTRNRLRHTALPALVRAFGPSFKDAILRAGRILREENAWMESMVPPPPEKLSCRQLRSEPLALRRRIVRQWLLHRGVDAPGFHEIELVLSLLNDGSGPARINLPRGRHARRTAGWIRLESASR